jgi:hypothetical protein
MPRAGIKGRVKHLRISDSGSPHSYGAVDEPLDTEVVVVLENSERYFGLEIKPGPDLPSQLAMLAAIREAFFRDVEIGFSYDFGEFSDAAWIRCVDLERPVNG